MNTLDKRNNEIIESQSITKDYREFLKSQPITSKEIKENMNFPLNTIFYGPPGTGKTYNTILRAAQIVKKRILCSQIH